MRKLPICVYEQYNPDCKHIRHYKQHGVLPFCTNKSVMLCSRADGLLVTENCPEA